MSTNFLKLPSELRNRVYELCLVRQEPIDARIKGYQRQGLQTPGFLRANKTVHREASSLFYAQNCFDFTWFMPEDVALFLRTIGRNNADYIRHVRVNFPAFLHLEPGLVTLEDDSISIFANIQSSCVNLSTLTTCIDSTNATELRLDALDHPTIVTEALELVDTRFRAISSLQEIIVEVYEDGPSDYIRRKMESHGWTINAIENVDDIEDNWGDDYDCNDGYDDDSRNDDPSDDEYDIDNDSDFWRRAAD